MKIAQHTPPRRFRPVAGGDLEIAHVADLELAPDEQVTLLTGEKGQWDVVRKDWGFYATPSLNRRLLSFGLRTALCRNADGARYVMIVEQDRIEQFRDYCSANELTVCEWLDSEVAPC